MNMHSYFKATFLLLTACFFMRVATNQFDQNWPQSVWDDEANEDSFFLEQPAFPTDPGSFSSASSSSSFSDYENVEELSSGMHLKPKRLWWWPSRGSAAIQRAVRVAKRRNSHPPCTSNDIGRQFTIKEYIKNRPCPDGKFNLCECTRSNTAKCSTHYPCNNSWCDL